MTSKARPAARTLIHFGGVVIALLLVLRLAGCVAIKDEDDDIVIPPLVTLTPTPVPVPTVPGLTDITVIDMHEAPASDPSLVRIEGTVVNHSNAEVSHVVVRVEARDILGRALTRSNVPALTEPIAAGGGTSGFSATMPRSTTIHDYHAEVIAK